MAALCKGCKQRIKWIKTPAGRWMPVDPKRMSGSDLWAIAHRKHWKKVLMVSEDGEINEKPLAYDEGYVPHWLTCPKAKDFKKANSKAVMGSNYKEEKKE